MHDDPAEPTGDGAHDPVALARRPQQQSLPQRFYTEVGIEASGDLFAVTLDGRPVRTPAKAPLALPGLALAEAVAAEWAAQDAFIDPRRMPLTRLANVAIDGVAQEGAAVAAEIARYGASDLLFYRADAPEKLVRAQARAWDPVLAASEARLGARFVCGEGIVFVEQPAKATAAVNAAVEAVRAGRHGHFRLAALHVMTALTGSVLLALAVGAGEIGLAEAWAAAHVDEDYQMDLWGRDAEAMARRAQRFEEMATAVQVWELCGAAG